MNDSSLVFRLGCRGANGSHDFWYPEDAVPWSPRLVLVCPWRLFVACLAGLLCLFTILGNAFALSAIVYNPQLRKKLTSVIISSLALADFLVGVFVMPLGVLQLVVEDRWVLGPLACRVWVSLDVVCCTASIVTLAVISCDRFLGVHHPLRYSAIVTRRRLYAAAALVWAFSVAVLLLTVRYDLQTTVSRRAHPGQALDTSPAASACNVATQLRLVTHSVVLSFYIPLVVILIAYFKIYQVTKKREENLFLGMVYASNGTRYSRSPASRTVETKLLASPSQKARQRPQSSVRRILSAGSQRIMRRTRRTGDDGTERVAAQTVPSPAPQDPDLGAPGLRMHVGGGAAGESRLEKQRRFYKYHKKSAKTLGLVVGLFLFCWLPFFLLYPIEKVWGFVPNSIIEVLTWLGYSNSALNPVIYALTVRTFRETFGDLCFALCRCVCGERISARTAGRLRRSSVGEEERGPSRAGSREPSPRLALRSPAGSLSSDGILANHTPLPRRASAAPRPSLAARGSRTLEGTRSSRESRTSRGSKGLGPREAPSGASATASALLEEAVEDVVIGAPLDVSAPFVQVRIHHLPSLRRQPRKVAALPLPRPPSEDQGTPIDETENTDLSQYDFRLDLPTYLRLFPAKRSDV